MAFIDGCMGMSRVCRTIRFHDSPKISMEEDWHKGSIGREGTCTLLNDVYMIASCKKKMVFVGIFECHNMRRLSRFHRI